MQRKEKRMKTVMFRKRLSVFLAVAMVMVLFTGCSSVRTERNEGTLSYEDAEAEISSMMKKVHVSQVENPTLDIYSDTASVADTLADIDTFPITTAGDG